ncbi:MAG: hypothetical protein PWP64_214 [Candidatus Cloacimonadota bacterium]|nr:hypothetical protein [Candidatus Cloacimonadota bacterium]
MYSKLISLFISVLNGGTKFSHINYMENGIQIFELGSGFDDNLPDPA